MPSIYQLISEHADKIPFALAASGNHQPRVSLVRIIEAVIIALVIAAVGYFVMVPNVIDGVTKEMEYVRRDVDQNTADIKENRNNIGNLRSRIDQNHGANRDSGGWPRNVQP